MRRIIVTFFAILLCSVVMNSQNAAKYERIYYKNAEFENENVKVVIEDITSTIKEVKFQIKITNKTSDYILYNFDNSKFEITGQDVSAKGKSYIVEPNDTKRKVFRAIGQNLNAVTQFKFICEGFNIIKLNTPIKTENFKLPASVNDFKAGPFDVKLVSVKKESDKTNVKYEVIYKGDAIGFVFPSKIAVLMPDGNTYATADSKEDALLLKKNESDKFSASWEKMPGGRANDMQLVEMFVTFTDVFVEGTQSPIKGGTVEIIWDEALTDAKSK